MAETVQQHLSGTFVDLEMGLSVAAAASRLSDHDYGIVVGAQGEPVALVVAGDLEELTGRGTQSLGDSIPLLPPTAIVHARTEMRALVESSVMMALAQGAHGVVVRGTEAVEGIISRDAVTRYLASGKYVPSSRVMGVDIAPTDAEPVGSIEAVFLTCKASVPTGDGKSLQYCGYRNLIVEELDDDDLPPCQNPDLPTHNFQQE